MQKVAFLGLGRMGALMAAHVRDAGHDLTVWNRTPRPFDGAPVATSVADAVAGADTVVLMLFGPESVREVLPQVVAAAPAGALVIDGTTIGPAAAREFGAVASQGGLRYVDAPVAGTTGPAAEGTLGVFAGGSSADYADAEPLLHLWGAPEKVRRVGGVGAGNALKLVVNQSIGVQAAGLGEALALAGQLGLDRGQVLGVLKSTAYGWILGQKLAMIESGDTSEVAFSIDLLAKDLDLAVHASGDADLAVTRAALSHAQETLDAGHAGEDYAALVTHLADEGRADSH
ncbi:MAG: 6-phosphogluconate dehydrogenase NAD-binding protein [Frankiales bacterium]|nr:6-phosphogluconate dehydrogenase NAD-binding protein [Frankiales bacterium]